MGCMDGYTKPLGLICGGAVRMVNSSAGWSLAIRACSWAEALRAASPLLPFPGKMITYVTGLELISTLGGRGVTEGGSRVEFPDRESGGRLV